MWLFQKHAEIGSAKSGLIVGIILDIARDSAGRYRDCALPRSLESF